MKEMRKRGGASRDLLSESKFETLETVHFGENPFPTQFGGKLRRIFVLPDAQSEPESIRILMRQIEVKLDDKP